MPRIVTSCSAVLLRIKTNLVKDVFFYKAFSIYHSETCYWLQSDRAFPFYRSIKTYWQVSSLYFCRRVRIQTVNRTKGWLSYLWPNSLILWQTFTMRHWHGSWSVMERYRRGWRPGIAIVRIRRGCFPGYETLNGNEAGSSCVISTPEEFHRCFKG